jgi:pimeloyl-ACP methyl ester carboxylesterase
VSENELRKSQGLRSRAGFPYLQAVSNLPIRTIEIETCDENPVRADVYLPTASRADAIVLLCHGFKGYRRWGFFPYLANRLCRAELAVLALDMSLNGTVVKGGRRGSQRYAHPELFALNTLRREYEDLRAAIQWVVKGGVAEIAGGGVADVEVAGRASHDSHVIGHDRPDRPESPAIGLFGHSRGAVAAVLNAIEQPAVRALCTWATAADPDFYTAKQKQRWRRDGEYAFTDVDGTRLAVGINYLNDLEQNRSFYFLQKRVRELQTPHLIVHGEADVVVAVDSARRLHEAETSLEDKRLLLLKTGHTFGVPYPARAGQEQVPRPLERAANETVDWFARYLTNGGME